MRFSFITLHPEFIRSYLQLGVIKRAMEMGLQCDVHFLRDFARDKHATVDDAPYGGGDGMVLRADVLADAVKAIHSQNSRVLLPSPRAEKLIQPKIEEFHKIANHLIFVCPRFAGVDQRFIDRYVDEEFSIGEYVVSGGELPSLIAADAIARYYPGALGNKVSVHHDTFSEVLNGQKEEDLYTRPAEFEGIRVPDVLTSGDHQKIKEWRQKNRKG